MVLANDFRVDLAACQTAAVRWIQRSEVTDLFSIPHQRFYLRESLCRTSVTICAIQFRRPPSMKYTGMAAAAGPTTESHLQSIINTFNLFLVIYAYSFSIYSAHDNLLQIKTSEVNIPHFFVYPFVHLKM